MEFLSEWSKYVNNELPAMDKRNLDNDRQAINIASKYLVENSDIEGNNDDLILDYNDLFVYGDSRKVCDKNYSTPWWLKVAMMRIERAVTPKESIPLRTPKPAQTRTRYIRTKRR